MDVNLAAAVALLSAIFGALGSVIRSVLIRPKTRAEADQLNAAATVSISQEAREWAVRFAERADAAERRADAAEHHADAAEHRAEQAEQHTELVEANLIKTYGYARSLRETIVRLGGTPPPPPPELERMWRDSLT